MIQKTGPDKQREFVYIKVQDSFWCFAVTIIVVLLVVIDTIAIICIIEMDRLPFSSCVTYRDSI